MFVKKIELLGFKTFADKTEIVLSEGITSIVGPNGSGKSNIADALLWVLGESNIRNIRGQKAIDVIFKGSDTRKALGMAEVSIVLDNSCGTLPINFSEVKVTRRAYKNGEAEYLINGTKCRLKDIYELFLDTGIGREAYSMVTQGEIDAVLSAKPEDRRELFEEAAGVKKYRHRRKEAVRKLEKTEENLRRVYDIMSELEGQLEPLKAQSEDAKKYNSLVSRLREIETGILIKDIKRIYKTLDEIKISKQDSDKKISDYETMICELEQSRDNESKMLQKFEEELENSRKVHQSILANINRLENRETLLKERLKSVESSIQNSDTEVDILHSRIDDIQKKIDELNRQKEFALKIEKEKEIKYNELIKKITDIENDYSKYAKLVNDHKANYLELVKEVASKKNSLQYSKQRILQLEQGIAKYDNKIRDLKSQVQDIEKTKSNLES
ncbi:MAG: AAA family ATPase, partial [Armatimonadota bacterium]